MKKIKVGLIGFGLSGRYFHAGLLRDHDGYEILKVFSSRRLEVQDVLPQATVTRRVEDLFEDPQIDLIINTAPNTLHAPYARAALLSGKHVVVEKPFVNTVAEGEELIALAQQQSREIAVFHNRRWDSDFLTIQKLIREDRFGQIMQFESHFDRWRPLVRNERWREQDQPGSGILFDLGAHLIDQALVLFGLPDVVTADVQSQRKDGRTDDYFHLILKYGKMRVILHSTSFANTTPRFQIFGSEANFVKFGLDVQEAQLKSQLSYSDARFGNENEFSFGRLTNPTSDNVRFVSSERGGYIYFYDLLYGKLALNEGEIPVTARQALDVIDIIMRARRSSKTGASVRL